MAYGCVPRNDSLTIHHFEKPPEKGPGTCERRYHARSVLARKSATSVPAMAPARLRPRTRRSSAQPSAWIVLSTALMVSKRARSRRKKGSKEGKKDVDPWRPSFSCVVSRPAALEHGGRGCEKKPSRARARTRKGRPDGSLIGSGDPSGKPHSTVARSLSFGSAGPARVGGCSLASQGPSQSAPNGASADGQRGASGRIEARVGLD